MYARLSQVICSARHIGTCICSVYVCLGKSTCCPFANCISDVSHFMPYFNFFARLAVCRFIREISEPMSINASTNAPVSDSDSDVRSRGVAYCGNRGVAVSLARLVFSRQAKDGGWQFLVRTSSLPHWEQNVRGVRRQSNRVCSSAACTTNNILRGCK